MATEGNADAGMLDWLGLNKAAPVGTLRDCDTCPEMHSKGRMTHAIPCESDDPH
jgi:hypothetical protein